MKAVPSLFEHNDKNVRAEVSSKNMVSNIM